MKTLSYIELTNPSALEALGREVRGTILSIRIGMDDEEVGFFMEYCSLADIWPAIKIAQRFNRRVRYVLTHSPAMMGLCASRQGDHWKIYVPTGPTLLSKGDI